MALRPSAAPGPDDDLRTERFEKSRAPYSEAVVELELRIRDRSSLRPVASEKCAALRRAALEEEKNASGSSAPYIPAWSGSDFASASRSSAAASASPGPPRARRSLSSAICGQRAPGSKLRSSSSAATSSSTVA